MSRLNRTISHYTSRRLRLRSKLGGATEDPIDFLKLIRDQMLFVATFFAVFGLITTDAYYSQFGLRYQFLGLDYSHILYRGFTLLYAERAFTIIFGAIILAVLVHKLSFRLPSTRLVIKGKGISYVLLICALFGGGYLSFTTGVGSAYHDMYAVSTTLQRLTLFHSNDKDKLDLVKKLIRPTTTIDESESALLLLHSSASEIVVFKAATIPARHPGVDIFHIRLSDDDHFSHASP